MPAKRADNRFSPEIRSIANWLQQSAGKLYSRLCRTDLGSSECKVGLVPLGGYVLGNMLLPGLGGAIGGMLGGYVGGIVDQQLFGGLAKQTVYGARMQDLRVQSSSYGSVIPTLYGKGRLAANVIWMRGIDEEVRTETQTVGNGNSGGGGGGGTQTQTVTRTSYHYYADCAACSTSNMPRNIDY